MYADPALDEKPAELLSQRGGAFYSEAAVAAGRLAARAADPATSTHVQVVNVAQRRHAAVPARRRRDRGAGAGRRDGRDARAGRRRWSRCTPGWSRHVTAYEELALDAALHGGRDRVFKALLAHPLVGQDDLADRLTDRLIAHNREHLAWA